MKSSVTKILLTISVIILASCTEEPDPGQNEYLVQNSSPVDTGIKVYLKQGAKATIVNNNVLLKKQEAKVLIRAHSLSEPGSIIDSIEVWNSDFTVKYKNLDLTRYSTETERITFTVTLPHLNSAPITPFNHSVSIYMDPSQLFGFFPIVEYPRTTNFFSTTDNFNSVYTKQIPASEPNSNFKMADVFGSAMIAYDANVHAGKTRFIKSGDNGHTWNPMFEFGFNTSDDAFTAVDFIDENKGWFVHYTTVFHGQVAQTYASDIYHYNAGNILKISTIDNYSVSVCKFVDENTGYALASASKNVIPAGGDTYFFKTTNGGVSWSEPVLISDSDGPYKFFKLNGGKLIAFMMSSNTLEKKYFVSLNEGETWSIETAEVTEGIRDMYFLENGTGYIKTGHTSSWIYQNIGDVYKTINGGQTWTKQFENISGSSIWFYNTDVGYLQDLIYSKGQILYTTADGGVTWNEVLYPYDYIIE